MADFNSKYTGQQVEALLDIVSQESKVNRSILTCEFMGEVGDVIWSEGDDHDRIDYIANWMEALSMGKVCVLDFDDYEGTYAMVHAINYRNDVTYGIGKVYFSYVFEGYLYDVEYESVSLPVTITIVSKTKIGDEGGSTTKEVVVVNGDTIDLLEPNKIYLVNRMGNSLQISEIVYPDGPHAEYCIMSNGDGFGGAGSSISLIFPDDASIHWVGDDVSSILNADIWELSIVYTESPADSCFKCVLTKFT